MEPDYIDFMIEKKKIEREKYLFKQAVAEKNQKLHEKLYNSEEYKEAKRQAEKEQQDYLVEVGNLAKNPDNVPNPGELVPIGSIIQARKGICEPYDDTFYVLLENYNGSTTRGLINKRNMTFSTGVKFRGEYKIFSIEEAVAIISSTILQNYLDSKKEVDPDTSANNISNAIHALGVAQGRFQ